MKAIEYINSFDKFSIKLGLERMELLMKYLDYPNHKLNCIHIAGTNGKGSTSAILAEIYQQANYKVGTFNSPHIIEFNERIRINGENISQQELEECTNKIKPAVEKVEEELALPTYFEVLTAIAIYYFAQKDIDLAIFEVGLGGRLDATNVIDSLLSAITNISYDHTEYLGDTIAKIAREKAGIIKKSNQAVITTVEKKEAIAQLKQSCQKKHVKFVTIYDKINYKLQEVSNGQQKFDLSYQNKEYNNLVLSLLGEHQIFNAALALAIINELDNQYPVREDEFRAALKGVRWPGRFELIKKNPGVILDGAHNQAAAKRLKETLAEIEYQDLYILLSIFRDKDIVKIMNNLLPLAKEIIISKNQNRRAADVTELSEVLKRKNSNYQVIEQLEPAIDYAIKKAKKNDLVLITGSLATVAEARAILS